MKYILSFIFLCIVVQCIQRDEDRLKLLKKMRRTLSTVKNIVEKAKKEKMRRLQQTDLDETIPMNIVPANIPSNSPTIASATPISDVLVVPPASTDGVNGTTTFTYVTKRFHGFEQASNGLKFGLLFSFYKKRITKTIIMRIIVTYSSGRLRILPLKTNVAGESVPTTCVIKKANIKIF